MHLALHPHPDSPTSPVIRIAVEVARRGGGLDLRYRISGEIDRLRLPLPTAPERRDALWRHTCFEAFVRPRAGSAYYEFNLAPSLQWAAYRFDAYRAGMRAVDAIAAPAVKLQSASDHVTLEAALDLQGLTDLPADTAWQLGLSAVIETVGGSRSYWALAHPPGQPDFHHPDCFACVLAAA